MANYANLKAAISQAIKTNGNQEITGQVLQDVLNSIVSVIGANYTFAGVATPGTNPGTPDQNVVYLAMEGGTYTNFNAMVLPAGISLLMWNGSWTSETVMYGDGGVFDISVYKSSGGTLATFADLSAALDGGNNIPASARKGGMSVKFVQSSDNKYVQHFLTKDEWSITPSDWVQVASTNDIEQLGEELDAEISKFAAIVKPAEMARTSGHMNFSSSQQAIVAEGAGTWGYDIFYIEAKAGDKFRIRANSNTSKPNFNVGESSSAPAVGVQVTNIEEWSAASSIEKTYTVLSDGYLLICAYYTYVPETSINVDLLVSSANELKKIMRNSGLMPIQENRAATAGTAVDLRVITDDSGFDFSLGKRYRFKVTSNVISRYRILSYSGGNIFGIYLLPNIEYILEVASEPTAYPLGAYIADSDVTGSGDVQFDFNVYVDSLEDVLKEEGLTKSEYHRTTSLNNNLGLLVITSNMEYDFSVGNKFKFKVTSSSISKYRFLSYNGKNIFGLQYLSPNVEYILSVSDVIELANYPFGVFVNADDVLSVGDVKFEFYPYYENACIGLDRLKKDISGLMSFLNGKKLITLCDSLGALSQWQTRLATKTGAIYDSEKNDGRYSFGGTATCNGTRKCAQDRAKLVVSDGAAPDIILIENVNDIHNIANVGTVEDVSFFKGSQEILNVTPQASASAAGTYWNNNFSTIINGITPEVGKVLGVPYTTNKAVLLKITGTPSADGNFGIGLSYTGGNPQYIAVKTTDSIQDIIDKILEYAWNNYEATQSGNDGVLFAPYTNVNPTITIYPGDTGITYTTSSDQSGTLAAWRFFHSHDTADWNDSSKWVDNIPLFSAWKGLTEYLQAHFPQALIYWFIPRTYQFDYTLATYKRADGTIDYDKVLADCNYGKTLFEKQIEFCDYYLLPYIDVRNETCMTPANLATYMNVNNVHPKQTAYDRWADIIAKRF